MSVMRPADNCLCSAKTACLAQPSRPQALTQAKTGLAWFEKWVGDSNLRIKVSPLTWPDSSSHMTMPKLYTSALGVSCDCARSSGGMYGMVCRSKITLHICPTVHHTRTSRHSPLRDTDRTSVKVIPNFQVCMIIQGNRRQATCQSISSMVSQRSHRVDRLKLTP